MNSNFDDSKVIFPAHWQVPMYQEVFWLGKTKSYCVVIPVINEGNRIIKLLTRMKQLQLDQWVDIVIVDGGSSDGSLESIRLQTLCVTGVLLKTGSGKLSAQLRCAYAFVMKQGYEGVITIDGNNKDDPDAIPMFITHLQKGYDFVQASRFIEGGVAENTPKIRDIAIRFIHAPMLSLSSGFKWTDTTQGFRAYSRKLLCDEQLAIFRDVFLEYELLAYLSHKAPRLHFRCIELATKRVYPEGEVPTKISSIRGNWKVLLTLIKACFGQFDAPKKKN